MMQKVSDLNKIETDPDKQSTKQGAEWVFPAPGIYQGGENSCPFHFYNHLEKFPGIPITQC